MILADKIITLRKKNGWSQEELADQLEVSRQSVSKWEGAQSIPDMNKILKLSKVFGVSTDYLLKDEIVIAENETQPETDNHSAEVSVSMEEANAFLQFKNISSSRIALGVMLCIFSPIVLILLDFLQENHLLSISEEQVIGIGMTVLLILVGIAVALFITTSIQGNRYNYLEKESLDTAYGVKGMVLEKRERFQTSYTFQITIGIILCLISVIPHLFLSMILFKENEKLADMIAIPLMLILVGFGVFLIVHSSIIWGGMNMLLEREDYTRLHKEEQRRNAPITTIYWCLTISIYLASSFITQQWHISWIFWPIAGVFYGVIIGLFKLIRNKA